MAYCLNPKMRRGHLNNDYALRCSDCEYFIKGASIDKYEITAFIGRGSFGDVYEVREPPPLGRVFALKVLRLDQSSDFLTDTFSDEAKRIASLQHRNILPVYRFGKLENNRPYFIMERAQETLYQRFQKPDGTLRYAFAEELIPFLEQAVQALDYIHKHGYIHQDIKPINFLLKDEQLFLADFGTAEYLGVNTHITLQKFAGTVYYTPLEQLQGKPRRESDQYALAVSVYQLLTGHVPLEYPRVEQMWAAIISDEKPVLPQKWNPRVPVEVGAVLLRAIAKDYQQRYPGVLAFAEAYKDAVNLALQRYLCQRCGHQNRSGAHRCSTCGAVDDNRTCPYCDTPVRFGQRCCAHCGRLTTIPDIGEGSSFSGLSIYKGRYIIKRVLKNTVATKVLVAVAQDTQANGQQVVVKRWPCIDPVLDTAQYEKVSAPLITLRHPLIPRIIEHFTEGKSYYHIQTYIDGESLQERLRKLLRPLSEDEVIRCINIILNILIALEQQLPPDSYRYLNITPTNIILDNQRQRVFLSGFQLPYRATRQLSLIEAFSPYVPLEGGTYNQQTLMYSLAACAHYALSNSEPSFGTPLLPIRSLNDSVSPALEAILGRALKKSGPDRYQTYQEMQKDIKGLLAF